MRADLVVALGEGDRRVHDRDTGLACRVDQLLRVGEHVGLVHDLLDRAVEDAAVRGCDDSRVTLDADLTGAPLGSELPEGVRFIGAEPGANPGWAAGDAPSDADLSSCVACGLCLPHCPTYRLTGEESASPRGRITAMRSVAEGTSVVDDTFARFMDLCLVCRACEDVCPSHVPFGRMMERARVQVEPLRSRRARFLAGSVSTSPCRIPPSCGSPRSSSRSYDRSCRTGCARWRRDTPRRSRGSPA